MNELVNETWPRDLDDIISVLGYSGETFQYGFQL